MKSLHKAIIAITGLFLFVAVFAAKAAEPFDQNLVVNSTGSSGSMTGWTITENSGEGWLATGTSFRTSYGSAANSTAMMDVRTQTIDLLAVGFSLATLATAPTITVGEEFKSSTMGGYYFLTVDLLNSTGSVVATWSYQGATRSSPLSISGTTWTDASYSFSGYGSTVTQVRFTDGGVDKPYWGGYWGPEITQSTVKVAAVPEPATWAMLAAGAGLLAWRKRQR